MVEAQEPLTETGPGGLAAFPRGQGQGRKKEGNEAGALSEIATGRHFLQFLFFCIAGGWKNPHIPRT